MNTVRKGSVHELLVMADLLLRGYDVFIAVGGACFCDMIAHHGGEFLRVEVTSGQYRLDRTVSHSMRDNSKYDVLAIVTNGRITYPVGEGFLLPRTNDDWAALAEE